MPSYMDVNRCPAVSGAVVRIPDWLRARLMEFQEPAGPRP